MLYPRSSFVGLCGHRLVSPWGAQRKSLFPSLIGVALDEVAQCVPGMGLPLKIVSEIANQGADTATFINAYVSWVNESGPGMSAEPFGEINTWLERLATV